MPSLAFAADLASQGLPFYVLPSRLAAFLRRLVLAGMLDAPVPEPREARRIVALYAAMLEPRFRICDASETRQPRVEAANFISAVTPKMMGCQVSTQRVADYLLLLDECWCRATSESAKFTTFCELLLPTQAYRPPLRSKSRLLAPSLMFC
jgi:hypothetical protein